MRKYKQMLHRLIPGLLVLCCILMAAPQAQAAELAAPAQQLEIIQTDTTFKADRKITSDVIVKRGTLDLARKTMTVYGDVNLQGGKMLLNCGTLNVMGDLYVTGDLYLSYGTVNVSGNLIHSGGKIDMGMGALNVDGSYYLANPKVNEAGEQVLHSGHGHLIMQNSRDRITIAGDFYMDTSYGVDCTAGTLTIGGDIHQRSEFAPKKFSGAGSHKVILNGTEPQTITLESEKSTFAALEILNKSGILVTDHFAVESLTSRNREVKIQSENAVFENVTLNVPKVEISGDVTLNGALNLRSNTMNLDGSLIQTGGELIVNWGTLNIADDYYLAVPQYGEEGEVSWQSGYGELTMQYANGKVNVGGDFYMDSCNATICTAGTLTVGGNFTQRVNYSPMKFTASNTHKVILNGTEPQTVTLESPESTFASLYINNASGIVLTDYFAAAAVNSAAKEIKIQSENATFENVVLNVPQVTVAGSLNLEGNLNMKSSTLQVDGNLLQTNGVLDVNMGTLDVTGSFYMAEPSVNEAGEQTWNTGYGTIVMQYSKTALNVGGDMCVGAGYDGSCKAGTITVLGAIIQVNEANQEIFRISDVETIGPLDYASVPYVPLPSHLYAEDIVRYIVNIESGIIHTLDCFHVKDMLDSNKMPTSESLTILTQGTTFRPCKHCLG